MNAGEKIEHEIAQHALEEHRAVRAQQKQILAFIEKGVVGSETEWASRCLDLFVPFFDHLREHFSVEESGGFMKPVLEVRPTLHPKIEKLKQEHVEMLNTGHLVIDRLRGVGDFKGNMDEVRERILGLLSVLAEHERAENRLLVTAFDIDLGPGD